MAYQPTVWTSNDLITIDKLNKIENGIVNAEARAWNFDLLLNNWDQVSNTEYTYSIVNIEDIFAATWVEVNLGTSSQYVTSDIYWETGNNSITFTTSSLPTNNLNVTIVAWGTRAGASSGELIQDGRYPIYSGDLNDINENCILSVQYETVADANNGHAPVSILGTTHYTVITHFFSNSQKSQLAFSSNTNQVVMRNGIDEWQTVGAEGSGGSDTQVALTNYTLRINSISSLPYTNSTANDNITSKMVVLESTLSNPAAQTGDWTITTADGYITIEGSISGTTDLTLVMGVSNTTAPTIQTNLSSNAAVNLLQDNPKPGVTGILPPGYGGTGVSATDNADLLSKLGAVNTTIYERLNYVTVPANTSQTLVTRILQPGTWLILSYMTLQDSLSGNSFNNTINVITPTNDYLVGDTVRGDGAGGGGTVCFAVTTIPDSGTYTLTLSTYVGGHQTSVRCCYALIKLM